MEETLSLSPLIGTVGVGHLGISVGRGQLCLAVGLVGVVHSQPPALGTCPVPGSGTNTAPARPCCLQKVFSQNLVAFGQVTCFPTMSQG